MSDALRTAPTTLGCAEACRARKLALDNPSNFTKLEEPHSARLMWKRKTENDFEVRAQNRRIPEGHGAVNGNPLAPIVLLNR